LGPFLPHQTRTSQQLNNLMNQTAGNLLVAQEDKEKLYRITAIFIELEACGMPTLKAP
jgi:hypothetical protein